MNRKQLHAAILAECTAWLGTPYQHQASRKHIGCDCLGLLRGVWRVIYGVEPEIPPPYSPDWAEAGQGETLLEAAARHMEPMDSLAPAHVMIFRWRDYLPAKHIAIAVDERKFIHSYEHSGVTMATMNRHWQARIAGIFRFPLPRNKISNPDIV